jgi:hypothetical protein
MKSEKLTEMSEGKVRVMTILRMRHSHIFENRDIAARTT